jgi:hypothetical protein
MYRFLLILVIVFQFMWLAATIWSLNILADSYRRNERDRALVAWATNKTTATKAAFDNEVGLLETHRNFVAGVTICMFLVVDVFGFYLLWNYGKSKPMA